MFALDTIASPLLDTWWWGRRLRQVGPGVEVMYEQDEQKALVRCLRCRHRWVVDLSAIDYDAWCDCFKEQRAGLAAFAQPQSAHQPKPEEH
jgi:hypothetical protein